jgi:uncharacterized phage protein gp47/JayE
MSFPRPTLDELKARGRSDLESKLDGAQARLYGTPEQVLADVSAGHAHSLHGHLDHATRQLFPHLQDEEWVDESMKTWKVSNGANGFGRIPAKPATGAITLTKNVDTVTVSAGVRLVIGDLVYTIDVGEDYTYTLLGGSTHSFAVTAVAAGLAGNADTGATISLETPIAGVDTDGTVDSPGLADGSDLETLAAAQVRLLEKIRAPGAGGARGDFITLAKAVSPLVTRAWELPRNLGSGTMHVLIADDNEDPPVASAGLITLVQDALQDTDSDGYVTGTAPTSAVVTVASVTTSALAVSAAITLKTGETLAAVTLNIETELLALITDVARPGVTITVEEIAGAIQRASGVLSHTLTVPAADVTHTTLQIPIAGSHTIT